MLHLQHSKHSASHFALPWPCGLDLHGPWFGLVSAQSTSGSYQVHILNFCKCLGYLLDTQGMSQHVLVGISTGSQMVRIVNGQVVNSAALQKRLRYHRENLVYQHVQTCGNLMQFRFIVILHSPGPKGRLISQLDSSGLPIPQHWSRQARHCQFECPLTLFVL